MTDILGEDISGNYEAILGALDESRDFYSDPANNVTCTQCGMRLPGHDDVNEGNFDYLWDGFCSKDCQREFEHD